LEIACDFHFLIYIASLDLIENMRQNIKPLLEAIKEADLGKALAWSQSESWATVSFGILHQSSLFEAYEINRLLSIFFRLNRCFKQQGLVVLRQTLKLILMVSKVAQLGGIVPSALSLIPVTELAVRFAVQLVKHVEETDNTV